MNAMLGLRNIVCSDRWSEEWPLITNQLRQQARERRNQQRQKRRLERTPVSSEAIEAHEVETVWEPPETKPKEQRESPKSSGPKKTGG